MEYADIKILCDFCFIHFDAHLHHKFGRVKPARVVSWDFSLRIIYCWHLGLSILNVIK